MDWPTFFLTILGAFIGAILSFLATKYYGLLDYCFSKVWSCIDRCLSSKFILAKKANNIYNGFTSFDKNLNEFASITKEILDAKCNKYKIKVKKESKEINSITITNIKEPHWYWEQFENTFNIQTDIGGLLDSLKSECSKTSPSTERIKCILNKIYDNYYNSTTQEVKLFPHQYYFKDLQSKSVFRINIFKATFSCDGGINKNISEATIVNKKWLRRNPLHTVLLFHKIFSSGVDNRIIHPFVLSDSKDFDNINQYMKNYSGKEIGTDSIIFSNKDVYNYDPEINAISYFRIAKLKKNINSFFTRVIGTKYGELLKFEDIIKKNYNFDIKNL